MEQTLPVLAGVLLGVVGGLPYPVVLARVKRLHKADIVPGAIAVGASMLVCVAAILVGYFVAGESFSVFAVGLMASYLVVLGASIVWFARKPRA